jgi:hypothetical protein
MLTKSLIGRGWRSGGIGRHGANRRYGFFEISTEAIAKMPVYFLPKIILHKDVP